MFSDKTTTPPRQIINFLFSSCFWFWLLLVTLELIMPGFVIYYLNLNLLLLLVMILAIVDFFLSCKSAAVDNSEKEVG